MGTKKVGTLWLPYKTPEGSIAHDNFDAELNDAVINGDITGSYGWFAGTLTADAIDAVDNISIANKAIGFSVTAYKSSTGYAWNDDGVYRDIMRVSLKTPTGDTKGGTARAVWQFKTIDGKGDNGLFWCQFRALHGGRVVWESSVSQQKFFQYAGQYFTFTQISNITPGNHDFAIQYRIFDRPTNAYPRFDNVRVVLDYSRK